MKLSVIIPARNEAGSIEDTIVSISGKLNEHSIVHEIIVVNDHSQDDTEKMLSQLSAKNPSIHYFNNQFPPGFGFAIRYGLEKFSGDCVAIMMADLSDSPDDLVRFYRKIQEGNFDCVFGSRFIKGGASHDYPLLKLFINRLANFIIRAAFMIRYNDTTNAFKMYKRETIEGLKPFLANHYNFTIELPLKAIIRGYSYAVLPNSWRNRKHGVSKLKIREMGSRYFFILLYCLIEKFFSVNDYRK